jgi:hypothetical protein
MLVGTVSDERYVALHDVLAEFERDGVTVAVTRSPRAGACRRTSSPAPIG